MKKSKTEYQVTIGYHAVICVPVKAANEDEAKSIAKSLFKPNFGKDSVLENDSWAVHGIVNMTETWNKV